MPTITYNGNGHGSDGGTPPAGGDPWQGPFQIAPPSGSFEEDVCLAQMQAAPRWTPSIPH
jgi:hypothetical protein